VGVETRGVEPLT